MSHIKKATICKITNNQQELVTMLKKAELWGRVDERYITIPDIKTFLITDNNRIILMQHYPERIIANNSDVTLDLVDYSVMQGLILKMKLLE